MLPGASSGNRDAQQEISGCVVSVMKQRLPGSPVLSLRLMSVAVLPEAPGLDLSWPDEIPDCEILPDGTGSDECGFPSVALMLCEGWHFSPCRKQECRTYRLWACALHLRQAQEGRLRCSFCQGIIVFVECL